MQSAILTMMQSIDILPVIPAGKQDKSAGQPICLGKPPVGFGTRMFRMHLAAGT